MTETVEVVIKMPKDIYKSFNESFNDPFDEMWKHYLVPCAYAIRNGTVLPKGHGRLIDADALIDSLDASDRDIYCKCVIEEDAPTIIKADKE